MGISFLGLEVDTHFIMHVFVIDTKIQECIKSRGQDKKYLKLYYSNLLSPCIILSSIFIPMNLILRNKNKVIPSRFPSALCEHSYLPIKTVTVWMTRLKSHNYSDFLPLHRIGHSFNIECQSFRLFFFCAWNKFLTFLGTSCFRMIICKKFFT